MFPSTIELKENDIGLTLKFEFKLINFKKGLEKLLTNSQVAIALTPSSFYLVRYFELLKFLTLQML